MFRPTCLALWLCPAASFAQISFDLTSIARPGDPAPVAPELVQVSSISLSDSGDVAFGADNAAFLQSNGTSTIVAALGDPTPAGGTLTYAVSPSVNAQGQVAFVANTAEGGGGVFLSTQGGLQPVAQQGDPIPGGGTFISFSDVSTSGAGGQLAFRASARVGFQVRRGLFRASGSALRALAYSNDPAPGGGTFRFFFNPVVNAAGQVAFFARLSPSGRGIFLSQPDGTLIAVAREGDPAPVGGRFDFSRASARDRAFHLERISGSERARAATLLARQWDLMAVPTSLVSVPHSQSTMVEISLLGLRLRFTVAAESLSSPTENSLVGFEKAIQFQAAGPSFTWLACR